MLMENNQILRQCIIIHLHPDICDYEFILNNKQVKHKNILNIHSVQVS